MNRGNEYLPNYVEHLVPLQEKKYLLPRKLCYFGVILALLFAVILLSVASFLQYLGGLVFLLLLGVMILAWYLHRFVSVEFEYTVLGGEIRFEKIFGRQQRKEAYVAQTARIEKIAPVNGEKLSKERFPDVTKELFFASTMKHPRTWYAVIREENGEKTLLFLELTEKAEKTLRFLCRSAF